MLIDTHCHLDAQEFQGQSLTVISHALATGLQAMVIPAVSKFNFQQVMEIAHQHPSCFYALGWHPLYIDHASREDMSTLKLMLEQHMADPKFIAVGEIGLDYFVNTTNQAEQTFYFVEQLKLANTFQLPVILHVRKAIDDVLKYLRRYRIAGGIAHAFNGSLQQAEAFAKLGFKLGFGGAMTYSRATRIRAVAQEIGLEHIVLETDAPDIPPEWLEAGVPNRPSELLQIASVLAALRESTVQAIIHQTSENALAVFPRMRQFIHTS